MTSLPGGSATPVSEPALSHNRAESRFEARVGDTLAGFAEYSATPGVLLFTHTEVEPRFAGQGVGGALARFGLGDAREQGVTVVPLCSFIARWIDRHPEYGDLLG